MCPYSHGDPKILGQRFEMANKAAMYLMKKGYIVFSPISYSHLLAAYNNNHLDHDFWLNQDRAFIDWADIGVVLCLDGWRESRSVTQQRGWFEEIGKPVARLYVPKKAIL